MECLKDSQPITQLINVERSHSWSALQTNTYQTTDLCSDKIWTWKQTDLNTMPFTCYVLTAVIVIFVLMWIDDKKNGRIK